MKLLKYIFLLVVVVSSFSSCTKTELEEEINGIENIQQTNDDNGNIQSYGEDDEDVLSDD